MNHNIVLIIGNSVDSNDSKPFRFIAQLKQKFPMLTFIEWDPSEELPEEAGKDIVLIDTIQGIRRVQVFDTLDHFALSPRNTVHDFDLPVALNLLKKIGKINTVSIIGIPYPTPQST